MAREISITKSKRLAKDIAWAKSEVARVRARALAEARLDPKGRSLIEGRGPWLRGYIAARCEVVGLQGILAHSVIVKGATLHYTGRIVEECPNGLA